ncbi:MAG TPA: S41 family peptidase [Woeseiaceae bacterium]|nr:S41 family peptidase [Woeseiaceae bacterium]
MARLIGGALLAALAACGGGGGGGDVGRGGVGGDPGGSGWIPGQFLPSDSFKGMCANPRAGTSDLQGTVLDENNFLRSYSDETYLWFDEIVDQDPSLFDSPLAYFDELKTTERTSSGAEKDRFHFTIPTEEWEQLSQSGVSVGYGALWSLIATSPPRKAVVAFVEPGSPATDPGVDLARGAEVIAVDDELVENGDPAILNAGLFPVEIGESHTFTILDQGASGTREITMTSEDITSIPVHNVKTVQTNMGLVGYLLFNDHIATAETHLIDAVEKLDALGIQELVVDIRYNGGGFLAIASEFAYMIAGAGPTDGQIFEEIRFSDKHPVTDPVTGEDLEPIPFYTQTRDFSEPPGKPLPTLNLPRVFVLTGPNTCSASESIINSLRGIGVEVVQIGSTTCGKPYGFYATGNCGTTYFTIQFQGFNDKGFGEYGDGFSPQDGGNGVEIPGCPVADDFSQALGNPAENRFEAALAYIENPGTCPAPTGVADSLSKVSAPLSATDGITPKSPWRENRILRRRP